MGNVIASGTVPEDVVIDADSRASLKFGRRGSPDDTQRSIDERGLFLDGGIDEVKIFVGRALSDDEIRRTWTQTRTACADSRVHVSSSRSIALRILSRPSSTRSRANWN
jgi:hypothetical protein